MNNNGARINQIYSEKMINVGRSDDDEEKFLRRNITFKPPLKPSEPELTSTEELVRFLSINLICIVSIMMMMTFCYLSHIVYNNVWKPTVKQGLPNSGLDGRILFYKKNRQRREKADHARTQATAQAITDQENNTMIVDRRFDKEKELASKSANLDQCK